jgi:dTMP kinase
MKRGKYICLEGGDGTGKSTLAAALFKRLTDLRSEQKRFPSDGNIGRLIRDGLMGQLSLSEKSYLYLFAADGLQEEEDIQRIQDEGVHVICDRHPTLSGRVFQPLHHPEEHIETVYNSAAADGISMPDHLFVLDVPVEVAIERMANREKYKDVVFEKADPEYISKIRKRYMGIAVRFGGTLIDATRPTDELVELVIRIAGLE